MAPSYKREVKTAASRLTLTVVVELLNAATAASTVRVILPSLLFLRATVKLLFAPHFFIIYINSFFYFVTLVLNVYDILTFFREKEHYRIINL